VTAVADARRGTGLGASSRVRGYLYAVVSDVCTSVSGVQADCWTRTSVLGGQADCLDVMVVRRGTRNRACRDGGTACRVATRGEGWARRGPILLAMSHPWARIASPGLGARLRVPGYPVQRRPGVTRARTVRSSMTGEPPLARMVTCPHSWGSNAWGLPAGFVPAETLTPPFPACLRQHRGHW
jgi:hypothetical protein